MSISAMLIPASSILVAGQSLSDTENWAVFLDPANYATSAPGESIAGVTVNYTGSTATATAALADGDTNVFSITVTDTAGTARTFSAVARTVRQLAPTRIGTLPDQSLTRATGVISLDAAAAFSGADLVFALSGPAGVSIAAATGLLSFDTDVLAGQTAETVTITATNSGGSAQISLVVNIVEAVETDFVMTVETTAPNETFTIPMVNSGTYSGTIDFGDGAGPQAYSAWNDAAFSTTYPTPGIHTVRMQGQAGHLFFQGNSTSAAKVRTVENLGQLGWQSMQTAFSGCSGMTSFTGGNTDTSAVQRWDGCWFGCAAMTSCDLTGMSFAAAINLQSTWAGCVNLTEPFDFTVVTSTGAKPNVMDECFFGVPAGPDLPNLDPSGLDITGFDDNGSYTGGLFNFLNNRNLSTAIYDQLLVNWAAQLPIDVPFDIEANGGFICDFQSSQPTMGGAVETARAALINAGFYMEDAESTAPDAMAAPGLTVDSASQITIARGTRPFSGGLPIRWFDYRYSTDEVTWTEVLGTLDDQWTSKVLSGLTANTDYFLQIRARAPGYTGPWSVSATAVTAGEVQSFTATRSGTDLVLTDLPDRAPQGFTAEAQGVDLVITFTDPIQTPAPKQIAIVDAANHNGTEPDPGSYDLAVFDLGEGVNNVYTLSGANVPAGAMTVLLDPEADVVGGGLAEFDRVVFIGASIMEQTFGSSLTQRNSAAEAAFAAQGVAVEVYAHATSGMDAGQVQSRLTEAMAAFPDKTIFFVHAGGNNVTANRPYPGGAATLAGQIEGLIDIAATRPGSVILSDLTFRDYNDTTATNEGAGAQPYNEAIYLPAFQSRREALLERAYYADGTPVSCLYEWSWENRAAFLSADNVHPANPGGRELLRDWLAVRLAPLCLGLPAPAQFSRTTPAPGPALDIFVNYGVGTATGVNTPAFTFLAASGQTADGPFALLNSDGTDPGVSLALNFSAPASGTSSGFGINTAGNGDGATSFDGMLLSRVFTADSYFAGAAYTVNHVISGLTPDSAYRIELVASRGATDSRETLYAFANGETATLQTTANPTQAPAVVDTISDATGTISFTQSAVSGSWSYLGGLHLYTP